MRGFEGGLAMEHRSNPGLLSRRAAAFCSFERTCRWPSGAIRRDAAKIVRFGTCGAAGAAIGAMIGLGLADAAAHVFGDVFPFYHFALTLGAISAGVAVGLAIAQGPARLVTAASLLGAALVGFCCGLASGVVAQDRYPSALDVTFAAFAWTVAGGLVAAMFAIRVKKLCCGGALCGGLSGGMATGAWIFDPFADGAALLIEAAGFGCLVAVLIVVADALLDPDPLRKIDGAAS
jgi:hypothetical protein